MAREYDLSKIAFKGDKKFLSNMYQATICVNKENATIRQYIAKGIIEDRDGLYRSTEHFYQANKSHDPEWKKLVGETADGEKVKSLARRHLGKRYEVRSDWDIVKIPTMKLAVFLKFSQHRDLRYKLLCVDGEIIEENCWNDTFWGTCEGEGDNHLGILLEAFRDRIV